MNPGVYRAHLGFVLVRQLMLKSTRNQGTLSHDTVKNGRHPVG